VVGFDVPGTGLDFPPSVSPSLYPAPANDETVGPVGAVVSSKPTSWAPCLQ